MGSRNSKSYTDSRKRKRVQTGNTGKSKPMDVEQFAGMSLQEIEDSRRGLDHEEVFFLDENDQVTNAYMGGPTSVAFPGSLLLMEGATVTHNHPIGSEGYGATFSLADVKNMAVSRWSEHRAVSSGRDEYNYIIRRNSRTTSQNSIDLYDRIVADTPMIRRRMNEALSGTSGRNLSASAIRQVYTGVLDRYYAEVLPQYNFDYVVRNRTYDYGR